MSEGYAIEDRSGETVGLVVRQVGERVFRFFSAAKEFDALDGSIFATARAAQRAVNDLCTARDVEPTVPGFGRREAVP